MAQCALARIQRGAHQLGLWQACTAASPNVPASIVVPATASHKLGPSHASGFAQQHRITPLGHRSFASTARALAMDTFVLQIQDPGPNPQKVGIILEELRLPFTVERIRERAEHEAPDGGTPAVKDKNTGMIILADPNNKQATLWESLAIVEYLVQTYDKQGVLHYPPNSHNWWMCQQWLAYQMGAQSPFFSLKAWFSNQHVDAVPSVIERFSDDVTRILGILEHYLSSDQGGYLVGDKCTFADLVFVPWNNKLEEVMGKEEAARLLQKYPHYREWHRRLMDRPAVQTIMQHKLISTQ